MKPILKWAGGKRKLLPHIREVIEPNLLKTHTLYEPFVGGGAVFIELAHNKACINDLNAELVNVYLQIKDNPQELIEALKIHSKMHSKEYFYSIRALDRNAAFNEMSAIEKAARTIYLNRTCYNGLYRVNSKGEFNVPYGRYANPEIVLEDKILELNNYFNTAKVTITNLDFAESVKKAKRGDVIYFDPPYDYDTNGFTSYTSLGFSREDLLRLKKVCDSLIDKGCKVVISNNDTIFVNEVFQDKRYTIKHVTTSWTISCDGKNRKKISEIVIYG